MNTTGTIIVLCVCVYHCCCCCRTGDLALLWPINQKVLHECYVEAVERESVVLKITPTDRDAWYVAANQLLQYTYMHIILWFCIALRTVKLAATAAH